MMKLDGKITISRVTGTGPNSTTYSKIHVSITDSKSGIGFVEAILELEDFAKAVTAQGHIKCDLEVRGLDNVGKKRILMEKYVDFSSLGFASSDEDQNKLAQDKADPGWFVNRVNTRERNRETGEIRVSYYRYVEDLS